MKNFKFEVTQPESGGCLITINDGIIVITDNSIERGMRRNESNFFKAFGGITKVPEFWITYSIPDKKE